MPESRPPTVGEALEWLGDVVALDTTAIREDPDFPDAEWYVGRARLALDLARKGAEATTEDYAPCYVCGAILDVRRLTQDDVEPEADDGS